MFEPLREENLLPKLETFTVWVTFDPCYVEAIQAQCSRAPSGKYLGSSDVNIHGHEIDLFAEKAFKLLFDTGREPGRHITLLPPCSG
jgi:hypothetical protein